MSIKTYNILFMHQKNETQICIDRRNHIITDILIFKIGWAMKAMKIKPILLENYNTYEIILVAACPSG